MTAAKWSLITAWKRTTDVPQAEIATAGSRLDRVRRYLGVDGGLALGLVTLVIILLVLAPWVSPSNPNSIDLSDALAGPSSTHPLGTDQLGRDILSRLLWGSRTALIGPLTVVAVSVTIGVTLAVTMVWWGGTFDEIGSRFLDAAFAFPGLLLALLVVATFGAGLPQAAIALAIAYVPYTTRVTRSVLVQQRHLPFVDACLISGMSPWRICTRHLIPNVWPFIIAQSSLLFGYALIDLAALSYLGLSIQPPTPDWGSMVNDGQQYILSGSPGQSLFAALAIVAVAVAVNVLGQRIIASWERD